MAMIKNVRINWVNLLQPRENLQKEMEYSVQLIISKDNKDALDLLNDLFTKTVEKATDDYGSKVTKGIKFDKLKDGDLARDKDDKPIDCLKNSYYMSVKNKKAPTVIKAFRKNGEIVRIKATEEDIYSGCYGYVDLNPFFYNTPQNRGVTFYINSFIKTKDGEKLGSQQLDVYSVHIDDAGLEEFDDFVESLPEETPTPTKATEKKTRTEKSTTANEWEEI